SLAKLAPASRLATLSLWREGPVARAFSAFSVFSPCSPWFFIRYARAGRRRGMALELVGQLLHDRSNTLLDSIFENLRTPRDALIAATSACFSPALERQPHRRITFAQHLLLEHLRLDVGRKRHPDVKEEPQPPKQERDQRPPEPGREDPIEQKQKSVDRQEGH